MTDVQLTGNARVAGLERDLGLTDKQYQICVTTLYVPFIFSEMPSNLILKYVGPRWLLPTILTVWGVITCLQGRIKVYTRNLFMLDVHRHCYQFCRTPHCSFFHWNGWRTHATQYCSLSFRILHSSGAQHKVCWLQSQHLNVILIYSHRIATFFTAILVSLRSLWMVCWRGLNTSQLAGAFSGLLAAAISRMDDIGGRRGWQWIFILVSLFALCIISNTFFLAHRRVFQHLSLSFLVFFLFRRLLKKQNFWPRRRKSKLILIDQVSSWH